MSWVDYCIIAVVALSLLVGLLRGFVREVLGAAAWIAAFAVAWLFGPEAARILAPHISTPSVRLAAGYSLLFFGVLFAGALITHLVSMMVRQGPIAGVDRMLGGGFGLVRGLLAVVVVIMLAGLSTVDHDRWWRDSKLIPPLLPLANALRSHVPQHWLAAGASQHFVQAAGRAEGS